MMHDRTLGRHLGNGRFDIGSLRENILQDMFTAVQFAALDFGRLQGGIHRVTCICVDQRANQGCGIKRIANRQCCIGADQAREQIIINILMHDQAA